MIKVGSWLTGVVSRFFVFLGEVHPLIFLTVYVICVPMFAVIYCSLDGGFYAPNAQHERAGRDDLIALRSMLTRKSWNHFICIDEQVSKGSGVDGGWRFHPKSVVLSDIKILPYGLEFDVHLTLHIPESPTAPSTIPPRTPTLDFSVPMRTGRVGMYPTGIKYDRERISAPLSSFVGQATPDCNERLFDFDDLDRAKIDNYVAGRNNDPLAVSGKFGRMMYFSVVVITTLGFGDIVPMTTASRVWVAVEAMLGTVLIGLMLNAVAHRARSKT